ncbi:MAG: hypothetical protein ACRCYY_13650 [Trueperaceae bacterium]
MHPLSEIRAGANFQVEWTGPNGESDYITLVPAAADDVYDDYEYTSSGSPIELTALLTLGQYELRYATDRSDDTGKVFARIPVEVLEAVPVFLQAPLGGSKFEVEWAGPNNDSDFITIVPVGADEADYEDYEYTKNSGNPLELTAPLTAGDYEVRYVNDNEDKVLGVFPVIVTEATATVTAPSEVAAGSNFEVEWTGPNNDTDDIQLFDDENSTTYVNLNDDGDPVTLTAPIDVGVYEIRYYSKGYGWD